VPAFAIPFAVRQFLAKWWPALLAGVVIIVAVTVIYFRGYSAGKTTEVVKQVQREAEVQVKINDANENAAQARVDAATALQNQAQELQDVQEQAGSVDALRIKRGCVVLRQQGRDTSKIPACR
jgi:hypothetical protein